MAADAFLRRIAPTLSKNLHVPVYHLIVFPNSSWEITLWTKGERNNAGGKALLSKPISPVAARYFSFLFKSSAFPPSLVAWAHQNGVPLSSALLEKSKKRMGRIVDYDVVSGLERKGLLVETTSVWYRVTVDVPLGEPDGGIIDAP